MATSSALVELRVLIFCLDEMFTGQPASKRKTYPGVAFIVGMDGKGGSGSQTYHWLPGLGAISLYPAHMTDTGPTSCNHLDLVLSLWYIGKPWPGVCRVC